jgi:mannitol-specific phosphotransferase system IIBC component
LSATASVIYKVDQVYTKKVKEGFDMMILHCDRLAIRLKIIVSEKDYCRVLTKLIGVLKKKSLMFKVECKIVI